MVAILNMIFPTRLHTRVREDLDTSPKASPDTHTRTHAHTHARTHAHTHVENLKTRTKQEKRLKKTPQEQQSSPRRLSVW